LPSLQKIQASHNSKKSYSAQDNLIYTDINIIPNNVNTPSNMNFQKKSYAKATKNVHPNPPEPDSSALAGTAILIKPYIKYTILPSFQNNCIQATNIALTLNHIPTTIPSANYHPGTKIITDDPSASLPPSATTF
jgi:hypothetical protein